MKRFLIVNLAVLASALALGHDGQYHGSQQGTYFLRGDSTGDGQIDIADAMWTLTHLYHPNCSAYCADAGDYDADGAITMADAVGTLQYLYGSGCPPKAPFPTCGVAPETLGCNRPPECID